MSSYWTKVRTLRHITAAVCALLLCTQTANAAQAVIGMPFTGKWAYNVNVNPPYTDYNSSHPAVHASYGADWATDLYAAPGTDVRVRVDGSPTLTVSSVTSTSCGAGKRVRISVNVAGVVVGSVSYEHLDTGISQGASIANGSVIGQTRNWGNLSCYAVTSNAGTHAHVSFTSTTDYSCYVDKGAPGVTVADGNAIGMLGSPNNGPKQACTSAPTGSGSTLQRIGSLDQGRLYVKEGPLNAMWTYVLGSVTKFAMSPNRVAAEMTNGELYVKEGPLNATWVSVTGGVADFKVTDNRVGTLSADGRLYVKEGPLNAMWTYVLGSVRKFDMSSNRIAAEKTDGRLYVKEGPVNFQWTYVAGGMSDFRVTNDRIAALWSGSLQVKDGPLNAIWTPVLGSVTKFAMSPNRVAAEMTNGELYVKEGPLNAVWSNVTGGMDDFQVTDNRIGASWNGQLHVKEGPLNATWTLVGGGDAFDLR